MTRRLTKAFGLPTLLLLVLATAVAAQESVRPGAMAEQSLRPYWHVFAAYAIAIALVMAWAASIAKRLSDIEHRLSE